MIEEFKPGEEIAVSELVLRAFELFISPDYSDEGRNNFRAFADADAVLKRFQGGDLILCSKEGDRIVGVLDVRKGNHICQFFVDPDCHGRGIGKALMTELVGRLEGEFDCITVNASPYAEKIYTRLGFTKTAERQVTDGIVHIPMKKDLVPLS